VLQVLLSYNILKIILLVKQSQVDWKVAPGAMSDAEGCHTLLRSSCQ
jgi:hypothetical protein